jgi:hypothetical protein
MRFEYDEQQFAPAAPVFPMRLSHPARATPVLDVPAQVDTGADVTAVPLSTLQQLQADQSGDLVISSYDGSFAHVPVFAIRLELPTGQWGRLNALGIDSEHVLLGRDVLNLLRLLLDGPALTLEVLPAADSRAAQ